MTKSEKNGDVLRKKLRLESGRIAWSELKRFFAFGAAINVSTELDLVEVAVQMSEDNKSIIDKWMQEGRIGKVSDEQAKKWFETDAVVYAVVVKPWVLVQEE